MVANRSLGTNRYLKLLFDPGHGALTSKVVMPSFRWIVNPRAWATMVSTGSGCGESDPFRSPQPIRTADISASIGTVWDKDFTIAPKVRLFNFWAEGMGRNDYFRIEFWFAHDFVPVRLKGNPVKIRNCSRNCEFWPFFWRPNPGDVAFF